MRTTRHLFALLLLAAALPSIAAATAAGGEAAPAEAAPAAASLYHRLGGYDAIAAVTDDFIVRLVADPRLARFFGGLSADSGKRLRQHVVDQLCAATGGPCLYVGRDMKTAHAGLGITEADWNAAVEDLVATLDRFRVPDAERRELFAILATLEPDIVEAP